MANWQSALELDAKRNVISGSTADLYRIVGVLQVRLQADQHDEEPTMLSHGCTPLLTIPSSLGPENRP